MIQLIRTTLVIISCIAITLSLVTARPVYGEAPTLPPEILPPQESLFQFTKSMLDSLSHLHRAISIEDVAEEGGKNELPLVPTMRTLIDKNKELQKAQLALIPYLVNESHTIAKLADNAVSNLQIIRKGNEERLQLLRNLDQHPHVPEGLSELQFKIAQLDSDQRGAYLDLVEKVNFLLPLMMENVGEGKRGKIQWRLSSNQRKQLLSAIENNFGSDFPGFRKQLAAKTGDFDVALTAANSLDRLLRADTFEAYNVEIAKMHGQ